MKNTTTANATNPEKNIINADNIQRMANAITIKALQTNYAKSGNEFMLKLLNNAIAFAKNPNTAFNGDGGDLIQDTALYLWQYKGYTLDDPTNDGKTDKDGNPISIKLGAYRNIHNIITKIKRKEYKQVYLSDYETENGEIAVPPLWDMPTFTDYISVKEIITALSLTENQRFILNKRLQGLSLNDIAKLKNISHQAVQNTLTKIAKKYISIYGEIAVPTLKKVLK